RDERAPASRAIPDDAALDLNTDAPAEHGRREDDADPERRADAEARSLRVHRRLDADRVDVEPWFELLRRKLHEAADVRVEPTLGREDGPRADATGERAFERRFLLGRERSTTRDSEDPGLVRRVLVCAHDEAPVRALRRCR